jgi:hypothetical protein
MDLFKYLKFFYLCDYFCFLGNSSIALISVNFIWESLIFIREFMKRLFAHKKETEFKNVAQPLTKPSPAFDSPLKDSYTDSSVFMMKDNTK